MKKTKGTKIWCIVTMLIVITSFCLAPALASNTEDTKITSLSVTGLGYQVYSASRDKQDSSAMYLWITSLSSNSYIRVKALGTNSPSASTTNTTNCTCSQYGDNYNYVTCYEDVDYSVHSKVYEWGYTYATYGFENPFINATSVTAWWSPDSWNVHVHATP